MTPTATQRMGGYADVAAELNRLFDLDPIMTRKMIYQWHKRGTVNKAGQLPPSPVQERESPLRTTTRWVFTIDSWVRWFELGVPGPKRKGWSVPVRRPVPGDDLTEVQQLVLRAVSDNTAHGSCTIRHIQLTLRGLDADTAKGVIIYVVGQLVDKGLVARRRLPKQVCYTLTTAGARAIDHLADLQR